MLFYLLALMYLLLSVLIGIAARKRRMGFVLGILLSLVVTPLVMFIILAITDTPGQSRQA